MEQTELEKYIHDQLQKDIEEIKKHIKILNEEMGGIQIEIEKIRGKLGTYVLITPILTGMIGAMAMFIITNL